MRFRSLLILFPIDAKYRYIIERTFNIYIHLKLEVKKEDLYNLLSQDSNYTQKIVKKKTDENFKGNELNIYLIEEQSLYFVNEIKKKKARREMDNLRYIETQIYRKNKPWQNHFHTTDNISDSIACLMSLASSGLIDGSQWKELIHFFTKEEELAIKINDPPMLPFTKVIIWGHKLHTHTHSYIHNGFFKAFQHMGYDTYWYDNDDDVCGIDFSNSLFLTEHQVDKNIPIRKDCKYILHNCFVDPGKAYYIKEVGIWYDKKYKSIYENIINIQVYRPKFVLGAKKLDNFIYYNSSIRTLYFPWATDILPYMIEMNKDKLIGKKFETKDIGLVGSYSGEYKEMLKGYIKEGKKNGFIFKQVGGYSKTKLTTEENQTFIQKVSMAPAIVTRQQAAVGYVPCRIFKNISYGALGITNSSVVASVFNNNIVYDSSSTVLFNKAYDFIKTHRYNIKYQFQMMDYVKEKHTYLNRIQSIFDIFREQQNINEFLDQEYQKFLFEEEI